MSEQLALVPEPVGRPRHRRGGPAAEVATAASLPVARVLVDTPLAHLDRPFEYAVPAGLDDDARVGARVRVKLAGREHDGVILARVQEAEHDGRLVPLRTVVSPEPVLTPLVADELRLVADRYGGTAADVLRLAVPPRHARAERSVPPPADDRAGGAVRQPDPGAAPEPAEPAPAPAWAAYPAGAAFLRRVAAGESPVAAWLALPSTPPGQDWTDAVVEAARTAYQAGRGALVVLPDHRDVGRVLAPMTAALGEDAVVRLTADLGPEARYRAFLRVLRGHARVVVGTRAAALAPVRDLGLLVCWDEADDLHQEPRAPYPHVREVLRLRAAHEGAALLVGGFTRSVEVQAWVERGSAAALVAAPAQVRAHAPDVVVAGEGWQESRDEGARTARIPSLAWRTLKEGLEDGPVLVQVPRQGYVVALACQDCRTPVRCVRCAGPVGAGSAGSPPSCRWCGLVVPDGQSCRSCGSRRRRATGVGERRTAEELGRAFPGTLVRSSGGDHVVEEVGPEPALVVATPGAEPWCPTGYAAVALLDGWRLLERADLDAPVEALRRWCAAAALVRPTDRPRGGRVVLCGVPPHAGLPSVEALVRWDPAWLAAGELSERGALGLPPARRHVGLSGARAAVEAAVTELTGSGHELVGTVADVPGAGGGEMPGAAGAMVREVDVAPVPLARAVQELRAGRSSRKDPAPLRTALDSTSP